MSWSETTLGPHIDLTSGPAFKSRYFTDDPSDVPLIKGENIGQGMILWDKSRYWSRGDADGYEKFKLQAGDVVLAMDRPWVTAGLKYAVINEGDPEALLVQRVARLRGLNGLSSQFLRYIIASSQFCAYAKNIMGGTNVPHISGDQIRAFRFRLPSLEEQQSISDVLSAYDDLIENNRRRIQLLEQAARLLYKEWFVYLRFPSHEHVKIKAGVPEGWDKKTAFDVMDVLSGGTPKTKVRDYWDGDIPFYTPRDAVDYSYVFETEKKITEEGLKNCNSKLYPKDTIFITARGTVGKINLAQTAMAMNQSCYALVAKPPLNQHYLYFTLVEAVDQFRSRAVGAVFDAIIRDTFKLIPFVVPDDKLLRMFTEHVSPILSRIDVMSAQTRKLVKARDLLLPRLMSGEIAA